MQGDKLGKAAFETCTVGSAHALRLFQFEEFNESAAQRPTRLLALERFDEIARGIFDRLPHRREQGIAALRHHAQCRRETENFAALVAQFRFAMLLEGFRLAFSREELIAARAAFILPPNDELAMRLFGAFARIDAVSCLAHSLEFFEYGNCQ